jgi:hypothetical protein
MKVLRIDRQTNDRTVFNNLEELRLALCDFHSIDWQENVDENDKGYKNIYSLSLQEICDHGDWSFELISNKDAKQYEVA